MTERIKLLNRVYQRLLETLTDGRSLKQWPATVDALNFLDAHSIACSRM